MHLTRRMAMTGAVAALLMPGPAAARPLAFDAGWSVQTFPRRKPNAFALGGTHVDVASDGGVSLLMRPLPQDLWSTRRAGWTWGVTRSVPATDLSRRGGDDRNLALYFVFLPEDDARRMEGAPLRRVLTRRAARSLVYVWGGPAGAARISPNPWLDGRGVSVALRPAGTGHHAETVDLAADHAAAFGTAPGALVGLGLSADSDDTASAIRARVADLRLSP